MSNENAVSCDWESEYKRLLMINEELKMQNKELKAHVEHLSLKYEHERGIIEGLKFAIRCDGVSGAEVRE